MLGKAPVVKNEISFPQICMLDSRSLGFQHMIHCLIILLNVIIPNILVGLRETLNALMYDYRSVTCSFKYEIVVTTSC